MKGLGILLTIAGAICAVIGYMKTSSWEYQLAGAFGASTGSGAKMALYGGIAALVVGVILLIAGSNKKD